MKCQGLGTNTSGDTMKKEPLNSYLEHFSLPSHTDSFRNRVSNYRIIIVVAVGRGQSVEGRTLRE